MSSDALWHIAWGNVGCQRVKYLPVLEEMIKYLLVFVEMIKLQCYTCCLFIIANKATSEYFLELLVVGGSTGLDFSCWLLSLKFRTESPILAGLLWLHTTVMERGVWPIFVKAFSSFVSVLIFFHLIPIYDWSCSTDGQRFQQAGSNSALLLV